MKSTSCEEQQHNQQQRALQQEEGILGPLPGPRRLESTPADRSSYRRGCQIGISSDVPYRIKTLFHNAEKAILPKRLELIHSNPNIYFVRGFLSDTEIDYFDKTCTMTMAEKAFMSSFTEDENQEAVISEERTSTYTYLSKGQDGVVRSLERKSAELAGLSSDCLEPIQIVSYTQGQQFNTHHDAGTLNDDDGSVELVMPRRLVTLLLYLNTLPRGQGHTEFPGLHLSVRPEKGCGILFCNVLEDGQPDPRTRHRACPVEGDLRKFALNVWMTDKSYQIDSSSKKSYKRKTAPAFEKITSALTKANQASSLFESASASVNASHNQDTETEAAHRRGGGGASDDETKAEEEEEILHWSDEGPPGIIGKTIAAPFFIWEEDGHVKKRKRIKKNFIGRIISYARSREGNHFYRALYEDGETEEIDGAQLQESIELLEELKGQG